MLSLKVQLGSLFFFLLMQFSAISQYEKMKFGKVTDADLQMSTYEQDEEAPAVILGDRGELRFDNLGDRLGYRFSRHRRIKILSERGKDHADMYFPYYTRGASKDNISIKVQVISPDGEKVSVDKENIFTEEVNKYWNRKKVAVPNVQIGSIIDYKIEMSSAGYFVLPQWYFQEDIPIRWSEYIVHIPEWYHYVRLVQGRNLEKDKQNQNTHRFTFGSSGSVNALVTTYEMGAENVPALEEEAYVTTIG